MMMSQEEKMSYTSYVAIRLMSHHVIPGDTLRIHLRNDTTSESMYDLAARLSAMFLTCYGFYPTHVAVHPDHMTIIKKQGKTLDILLSEKVAPLLSLVLEDLMQIPKRIVLTEDATLDLFTAVACFDFRQEDAQEYLLAGLRIALGPFDRER